jgi:hypothetical protein
MFQRFGAILLLVGVAACGDDDDFTGVTLDPANTTGVKFETQTFEVPQGAEIQDCYFFNMPDLANGQDYWVDRVRLGSNPGSHHANVFRVKTIVALGTPEQGDFVHDGECFKSGNWADWPLVTNNQDSSQDSGYFDWTLPSGVAYRFKPGRADHGADPLRQRLDPDDPVQGQGRPRPLPLDHDLAHRDGHALRNAAEHPDLSFQSHASYHGTCSFSSGDVTIAAANGHFHSRGTQFDIFKWDGVSVEQPPEGERFYRSVKWDDPPMTIYQDPSSMQVGEHGGIWWTCDYDWYEPLAEFGGCAALDAADKQQAGDCCYTFGPKVETSEHCNVFLYY